MYSPYGVPVSSSPGPSSLTQLWVSKPSWFSLSWVRRSSVSTPRRALPNGWTWRRSGGRCLLVGILKTDLIFRNFRRSVLGCSKRIPIVAINDFLWSTWQDPHNEIVFVSEFLKILIFCQIPAPNLLHQSPDLKKSWNILSICLFFSPKHTFFLRFTC